MENSNFITHEQPYSDNINCNNSKNNNSSIFHNYKKNKNHYILNFNFQYSTKKWGQLY